MASPALDAAWDAVEREVDDAERVELVRRAQDLTAEEVPGISTSPQLDIVVDSPSKVGGPGSPDPGGIFSRLKRVVLPGAAAGGSPGSAGDHILPGSFLACRMNGVLVRAIMRSGW